MPSISQLKQAIVIAEKIEALESQLAAIVGTSATTKTPKASKVVAAIKEAIADAPVIKKGNKAKKVTTGKRVMSPEAIEKIREAQKRRWANAAKTK